MGITKIPYADKTWNITVGDTHAGSPSCDNCWARELHNMRHKAYLELKQVPQQYSIPFGKIVSMPDRLDEPLHWRKHCRIFVCAMSDLFHPLVTFDYIDKAVAVVALCPQHDFLFFTKRIKRASEYFLTENRWSKSVLPIADSTWGGVWNSPVKCLWPLPNLQLIVSCSTQKEVDKNVPVLLQIPAAVRGISLEPLLEEIDISRHLYSVNPTFGPDDPVDKISGLIDWVIVGCESIRRKPGRFCDDENRWWNAARSIARQCKESGTAFYMKQGPIDGKVVPDINKFPEDLRIRKYPERKQ